MPGFRLFWRASPPTRRRRTTTTLRWVAIWDQFLIQRLRC